MPTDHQLLQGGHSKGRSTHKNDSHHRFKNSIMAPSGEQETAPAYALTVYPMEPTIKSKEDSTTMSRRRWLWVSGLGLLMLLGVAAYREWNSPQPPPPPTSSISSNSRPG